MNSLKDKVALISGAARGIGAQTARRMAEAGATVVIGDVLEDLAKETVSEINCYRRNSSVRPPGCHARG